MRGRVFATNSLALWKSLILVRENFFYGNKLLRSYAIAAKKQRRVKIQKRLFE